MGPTTAARRGVAPSAASTSASPCKPQQQQQPQKQQQQDARGAPINRRLLLSLEVRALLGALAGAALEAAAFGLPALLLLSAPWQWRAALALLWALAEVAFLVAWRRKHALLDAIPERHEPPDHDGWAFFERWHASSHYNVKVLAIAELIKCWFDNVPTMELRRGNAAELVARGYFYKNMDQLRAEGKDHLVEEMLQAIERVWGYRFADGLNPELQYLDHLREPLKATYRPLGFYVACECLALLKHTALLAAGFSCHTYGSYSYYTRGLPSERAASKAGAARAARRAAADGRRWRRSSGSGVFGAGGADDGDDDDDDVDASGGGDSDDNSPIVFLHGVGAGLLPYVPFLLRVTALGRPVLAVEYKHLSMRWTDFIPTAPQVADDMRAMFDLHGVSRATLVAHSYGTLYTSCLLKAAPERVHAACLIDPVCCCMWSGHLISNFVYSPAKSTTGLVTWLIARDLHTATSVSRNFFWTDVNLWPDEVPPRCAVVLSGRDDLVPVQHVAAMLRHETRARVLTHPTMCHADFLFSPAWQDRILAEVAALVRMPGDNATPPGTPTTMTTTTTAAATPVAGGGGDGSPLAGPLSPSSRSDSDSLDLPSSGGSALSCCVGVGGGVAPLPPLPPPAATANVVLLDPDTVRATLKGAANELTKRLAAAGAAAAGVGAAGGEKGSGARGAVAAPPAGSRGGSNTSSVTVVR